MPSFHARSGPRTRPRQLARHIARLPRQLPRRLPRRLLPSPSELQLRLARQRASQGRPARSARTHRRRIRRAPWPAGAQRAIPCPASASSAHEALDASPPTASARLSGVSAAASELPPHRRSSPTPSPRRAPWQRRRRLWRAPHLSYTRACGICGRGSASSRPLRLHASSGHRQGSQVGGRVRRRRHRVADQRRALASRPRSRRPSRAPCPDLHGSSRSPPMHLLRLPAQPWWHPPSSAACAARALWALGASSRRSRAICSSA